VIFLYALGMTVETLTVWSLSLEYDGEVDLFCHLQKSRQFENLTERDQHTNRTVLLLSSALHYCSAQH